MALASRDEYHRRAGRHPGQLHRLTAFLSGLGQRFGRTPIRVVTIEPGPVSTKMTEGQRKFLMTTPDLIALALFAACSKARGVVYLPWYWRPIMILIRIIPEALFRRLRFAAPSADVHSTRTHAGSAATAPEAKNPGHEIAIVQNASGEWIGL